MNNYSPSPFTVWLVQGSVAIPTAIRPGRRTGLQVWRCRYIPGLEENPPSHPSLLASLPASPPSSPWKRSSFSLWESTKGKKEKELSIKLSRASGAFSRGCHSLWGERGTLKTDFERTVQPQLHWTASSTASACEEHVALQDSLTSSCALLSTDQHSSPLRGQPSPPLFVGCTVVCPIARPFLGAHSRHHSSSGSSGSLLTCQKHQQACKRYFGEDVRDAFIPCQRL